MALTARTMLIDPVSSMEIVAPVQVRVLSIQETYAEKIRAALTRRPPAIHDFFDIDIALRKGLFRHDAPEFLNLVTRKLALTADRVDISNERIELLVRQMETHLKPVLRPADYEQFALQRVIALLGEMIAASKSK